MKIRIAMKPALLCAVLSTLVAACVSTTNGTPCGSDNDCKGSRVCVQGACVDAPNGTPDAASDGAALVDAMSRDVSQGTDDADATSSDEGASDVGVDQTAPALPDGSVCLNGERGCGGQTPETCVNGQWVYADASCGGNAPVCLNGACAECSPHATQCSGNSVQACNASGQWATSTACALPTPQCENGACVSCTCGGDQSCYYDQNPPMPNYGVTEVVLTPNSPTATFTANITAPGAGNHDSVWYDLDLSAFPAGGTLNVTGQLGASGCAASSYLLAQCAICPSSGDFNSLENDSDVPAGNTWTFTYQFPPVTVLHLGTEGNWGSPQGQTNTNKITVTAM